MKHSKEKKKEVVSQQSCVQNVSHLDAQRTTDNALTTKKSLTIIYLRLGVPHGLADNGNDIRESGRDLLRSGLGQTRQDVQGADLGVPRKI